MNYDDLENFRLEYKKKIDEVKTRIFTIWLVIVFAVFVLFMLTPGRSVFHFLFFCAHSAIMAGVAGVIYGMFHVRDTGKNYRKAYKAYFVSDALSKVFTDYRFNSDNGISKFEIQKTGMMKTGDVFKSNDLVTGKYKNINFTQSDVHIQDESTDSDGNTTYTTVFKGRWIIFDFKKDIDKKLAVVGKGFRGALVGKHGGYKELELESSEFHKHFHVYAQDGFEAYYVLDPAFMERVMSLAIKHNDNVYLAFTDGRLHIGIHDGKDSFEPPSYKKSIDEQAEKQKVYKDIKVITDIVDNLKLKA